jgi:hypothetical protein
MSHENFARISEKLVADNAARLQRKRDAREQRRAEHEQREIARLEELRKNRVAPRRAGDD